MSIEVRIDSVTTSDETPIPFPQRTGVVVFVGPNNSGKNVIPAANGQNCATGAFMVALGVDGALGA